MEIDWPHLQSTIIGNSTSDHEVDKLVSNRKGLTKEDVETTGMALKR